MTNAQSWALAHFQKTLGSPFDLLISCDDALCEKPDARYFAYARGRYEGAWGYRQADNLHVAQSQYHDIGVSRRLGIATCWIERRHGQSGSGGTIGSEHTVPDYHFHTPDAILAASQLVVQLNTIVARRIDPDESAVLSVTRIEGGHSHNVLPAEVQITGTVRSFDPASQDRIEAALHATAEGMALASGTQVDVRYVRYYPATVNSAAEAALALEAAGAVGLHAQVAPRAAFTSEDFAFMLQRKPGAYLWLGQGRADPGPDGEHALHHPCYDFNDDALPLGVRWFCEVAERALAKPSKR